MGDTEPPTGFDGFDDHTKIESTKWQVYNSAFLRVAMGEFAKRFIKRLIGIDKFGAENMARRHHSVMMIERWLGALHDQGICCIINSRKFIGLASVFLSTITD